MREKRRRGKIRSKGKRKGRRGEGREGKGSASVNKRVIMTELDIMQ